MEDQLLTPAINTLKKATIKFEIHEYKHDPKSLSYGEEAAEKLGIDKAKLFKTLVVSDDKNSLYVAVVPVSCHLNLKQMAKSMGVKKITMADKNVVQKTTGYILGGVSPIGQKKQLMTIIDSSANQFDTILVSAGRRGMDIELSPLDLHKMTKGIFDSIGQSNNG